MTSSHPLPAPCQWFSRLAVGPRPPVRPPARPAVPRRRPGPRPADRHQLDPGRRAERPVPALLHRRRRGREEGRHASPPASLHEVVKPLVGGAERLTLALDDTPTQRYGPHVQGAGVHHNPTPGPAGSPYVYGHVFVVLGLLVAHPAWGVIALPLLARLYVRKKDLPGIDPKHRPGVPDQAGAGRRAAAVGQDVAGSAGQAALGGGRRGLRQGGVPQAGDGAGDDGRQPAPQGRGPVDRARAAAAGPARAGRGSTATDADRPGQAGRPAARLGDRDVRPVRGADGQAVQDVPGDLAAGRRGDPGGAGGRADRVAGVLLHRPVGSGRRHPGGRGRPVQPGDRPSAIARRSSGRASSRCGSCGRTSGRSTSACGRSR